MELLPKELREQLPSLYSQEHEADLQVLYAGQPVDLVLPRI